MIKFKTIFLAINMILLTSWVKLGNTQYHLLGFPLGFKRHFPQNEKDQSLNLRNLRPKLTEI